MSSPLWNRMQSQNPTLYAICRDPADDAKDTCVVLVDGYFSAICSDPHEYGTQAGCKTFCEAKPHLCRAIDENYRNYCNTADGFAEQHCQDWCLMNPGYCNTGAREYCARPGNGNVGICSCINSKMNNIQGLIPECHDIDCYRWGYKTMTPSTATPCPSYVSCDTKLEIEDVMGNVDIRGVTIETNCGDATGNTTGGNSGSGADTATTNNISLLDKISDFIDYSQYDEYGERRNYIFIIFVVFIFLILVFLYKKNDVGKIFKNINLFS